MFLRRFFRAIMTGLVVSAWVVPLSVPRTMQGAEPGSGQDYKPPLIAETAAADCNADEPIINGERGDNDFVRNDSVDQLFDPMFTAFIREHQIPGCSVALADRGRMIYTRSFGMADTEKKQPVTESSLFRIASISKPITAVAILQLAEQGKLSLDDKVFSILKIKPHLVAGAEFDSRQEQITIRQLLQHRGGWDRDKSFDPMFQSVRFADSLGLPPPAKPQDIIRCMLGMPLDFSPGKGFAYSNYGYCLLGRVIETRSGESYEDYVKQQVLAPLGIRSMRLGHSKRDERAENEVRYYDPGRDAAVFAKGRGKMVSLPYGAFYLEAMDAHGGWLATAMDLVRFANAFEDVEHSPLLTTDSIRQMFTCPSEELGSESPAKPPETWYGLGWSVRSVARAQRVTSWHTGSLPGTSSILIRRYDGLNVAVLFNTRVSPSKTPLIPALEPPLHRAMDQVIRW